MARWVRSMNQRPHRKRKPVLAVSLAGPSWTDRVELAVMACDSNGPEQVVPVLHAAS